MKRCVRCSKLLKEKDFNASKANSDGLNKTCINCCSKAKLFRKSYRSTPEFKKKDKERKSTPEFKKKAAERARLAYHKEGSTVKEYQKTPEFKKKAAERARLAYHKEGSTVKEYQKNKYKNNPQYRVSINMSSQIRQSLKDGKGGAAWEKLVGYSLKDLMKHLESLFEDGMTWENYGEWHIDHRKPQSWFKYDSYDSIIFKECWAIENLQPKWASENISKGNKYSD